VTDSLITAISS